MRVEAIVALVAVVACARVGDAWTKSMSGRPVAPVAADPAGAVLAIKYDAGGSAIVTKLAGSDGRLVWRRALTRGPRSHRDAVHALLPLGDGDVIVAGGIRQGADVDMVAMRLSGRNGKRRWRRVVTGASRPAHLHEAKAAAVDAVGDVLVAGSVESATSVQYHGTADLAVVKLSGRDGNERWRMVLDGGAQHYDRANAVAVDRTGDVVAVGDVSEMGVGPTGFDSQTVVLKLAGADGRVLWRHQIVGVWRASSIVTDAEDDVVVAGSSTGSDFVVVKIGGANGVPRWEAHVSRSDVHWEEAFRAVVLDDGDVAAIGMTAGADGVQTMTVVRLDGATGAVQWQRDFAGDNADFGRAIMPGASGALFVGGGIRNRASCSDAVLLELDAATGSTRREFASDGTSRPSTCDAKCMTDPPPCVPAEDHLDELFGLAVDPDGRPILAGLLTHGRKPTVRGFVALPR